MNTFYILHMLPSISISTLQLLQMTRHFLDCLGFRILACTGVLWLIAFAILKQILWRDPHAAFFTENGVYDLDYSLYRQSEAREFIEKARSSFHNSTAEFERRVPVMCAAITTFNRHGQQYLSETIGSMLTGLSDEERDLLEVRVLFAHANTSVHSNWNDTWLDILDHWSGYDVSNEKLHQIQEFELAHDFYMKGVQ